MKSNSIKYLTSETFYVLTGLLTAGTLLQTFFLEMGIDKQTISLVESALTVIQSLSMFMFSGYIDKNHDIKGVYAKSTVIANLMLVPMLFFCFVNGFSAFTGFCIICAFAVLSRIGSAIQTVSIYKLPYLIINMKKYGTLIAISSITSGTAAILFSSAIMSVNNSLGFFTGMRYILIFNHSGYSNCFHNKKHKGYKLL